MTADGIARLEGYTSLEHLNAGNNPSVDDASAAHIAKVRTLRSFQAEQTAIGDEGLAHLAKLPALETLVLNSVPITDDGLKAPREHPTLRTIAIGWTKITDAGLAHLSTIPDLASVAAWDYKSNVLKDGRVSGEVLRAAF